MSWVRIDDGAPEHRKVLDAGTSAAWLWVCCLAYCNRQKARDGFIPKAKIKLLYPGLGVKEARKLVEVGLLDEADDGFRVHDYHDYQPDAERAEEIRAARAAAGRVGGQRSAEARAKQRAEATGKQDAEQATKQTASNGAKQVSTPSRPDPVPDQTTTPTPPTPPDPPGGRGRSGDIPCPGDLALLPEQRATLETSMIPGWAIDAITVTFRAQWVGSTDAKRSPDQWRRSLVKAVTAAWNDPRQRPKRPEPDAPPPKPDRTPTFDEVCT